MWIGMSSGHPYKSVTVEGIQFDAVDGNGYFHLFPAQMEIVMGGQRGGRTYATIMNAFRHVMDNPGTNSLVIARDPEALSDISRQMIHMVQSESIITDAIEEVHLSHNRPERIYITGNSTSQFVGRSRPEAELVITFRNGSTIRASISEDRIIHQNS